MATRIQHRRAGTQRPRLRDDPVHTRARTLDLDDPWDPIGPSLGEIIAADLRRLDRIRRMRRLVKALSVPLLMGVSAVGGFALGWLGSL